MTKLAEKKRQYTREAIIEAAEELFSRRGYHKTQVMDIVKNVGMSAGTFYNYFKDKRDLFRQITQQNFEELRIRIKKLREPLNIWDRSDRSRKLFESYSAYFDYIDDNSQQFLILMRGSFGVDEELDVDVWKYHSGLADDLAVDLQAWINIGIIEGIKPQTTSYAVVGMAQHLGLSYVMEQKITREDAIETLVSISMAVFDTHMTEAGKKGQAPQNRKRGNKEP